MKRRDFFKKLGGGALGWGIALGSSTLFLLDGETNPREAGSQLAYGRFPGSLLRPPGAVEESLFLRRCIGCFQCAEACPTKAIKFIRSLKSSIANTPFIIPWEKGCSLCMKCTQVCPTGALKEIADDRPTIQREVKIGVAIVNELTCYAHNKRAICGACYYVCPFPHEVIEIKGPYFKPEINSEKCVGCGLCEEICPQKEKSIRIRARGI